MAAVAAREREVGEELGNTLIEDGAIVAAGLVAEGQASQLLPTPVGPHRSQIVVGVDPFALGELLEQGAVEAARGTVIDVFDAGLLAQFGVAQPRRAAACRGDRWPRDRAAGRAIRRWVRSAASPEASISAKALAMPAEAELVQLVERRMVEQGRFS